MIDQIKILEYLNQTLPPDEQKAFEEAIQQDAALAREVALHKDILLSMKIYGQEGIVQLLEDVWQQHHSGAKSQQFKKRRLGKAIWGYAAIFLLLITSAWALYQFGQHPPPLASDQNALRKASEQKPGKDTKEMSDSATSGVIAKNPSSLDLDKPNDEDAAKTKNEKPQKNLSTKDLRADLEQKYQSHQLPFMETQISVIRLNNRFQPDLHAILKSKEVRFEWPSHLNVDTLEIEIITKVSVDAPTVLQVPYAQNHYTLALPNGLYYWRLNLKNGEMIHLGRFFVHQGAVLPE
ncbi:MAG: hypothetical protein OHK0053_30170 [Microscillaceae bacterium]